MKNIFFVVSKLREKTEIRIEEVELFCQEKSILRDWHQAGSFTQCTGHFLLRCITATTRQCAAF